MRALSISLLVIALIYLVTTVLDYRGYRVVYSKTASMPSGLYLIIPKQKFSKHEVVEFIPPDWALDFLKERGWINSRGSIIKYVFAVAEDSVCNQGDSVIVNDKVVGKVQRFLDSGKQLPKKSFCGKVPDNHYLLMSNFSDRSFDSRYFGLVSAKNILGKALPILMWGN
jgi:signal peptidase I, bacterial type